MLMVNQLAGFGGGLPRIMPVTSSFTANAASNSNSDTYTFSTQAIGAANADRYVIVGFMGRETNAVVTVTSVTIGGVTATLLHEHQTGLTAALYSGLYIAKVPTGTTADVVIVFGTALEHCGIGLWRIVGAPVIEVFGTGEDVIESSATVLSDTISVPADGTIVGVGGDNGVSNVVTWAGITEDWEQDADSTATTSGARDDFTAHDPAVAVSATFNAAITNGVMALAAIRGVSE